MQKAFDICSKIFIFAFLVLVTAIFTNITFPDEAMDKLVNSNFIGLKEVVSFIKAIDTADFYLTILSGLASLVTYIGKRLSP